MPRAAAGPAPPDTRCSSRVRETLPSGEAVAVRITARMLEFLVNSRLNSIDDGVAVLALECGWRTRLDPSAVFTNAARAATNRLSLSLPITERGVTLPLGHRTLALTARERSANCWVCVLLANLPLCR